MNVGTGVSLKANKEFLMLAGGAVALVLLLAWYGKKKVGDAVWAINPGNDKNVFAETTDKLVKTATGNENASLGTAIYDWLNPSNVNGSGPRKYITDKKTGKLVEVWVNTGLPVKP